MCNNPNSRLEPISKIPETKAAVIENCAYGLVKHRYTLHMTLYKTIINDKKVR